MNRKTDTKPYTFEILTLNGEWRGISGRSLNSIDDETGSSVFAASENGRLYVCFGIEAAKGSLDYFGKIAGHHRVRIANGEDPKATLEDMKKICDELKNEIKWEKAMKTGYKEAYLKIKSDFERQTHESGKEGAWAELTM